MFASNWVVFLEFEFARCVAAVLSGGVEKSCTSCAFEFDFFAYALLCHNILLDHQLRLKWQPERDFIVLTDRKCQRVSPSLIGILQLATDLWKCQD